MAKKIVSVPELRSPLSGDTHSLAQEECECPQIRMLPNAGPGVANENVSVPGSGWARGPAEMVPQKNFQISPTPVT